MAYKIYFISNFDKSKINCKGYFLLVVLTNNILCKTT